MGPSRMSNPNSGLKMENPFKHQTPGTRLFSPSLRRRLQFGVLLVTFLAFTWSTDAQQRTGIRPGQVQRGGGAGRTLGGGGTAGAGGTRQYTPNGMVGEAMVTSDPETRRLIVITDDE